MTAGDGEAGSVPTVWDLDTGEPVRRLEAAAGAEYVVTSPDCRVLATSGTEFGVAVVDVRTGASLRFLLGVGNVEQLAFGPDGTVLAGVAGSSVWRWQLAVGDAQELPLLSVPGRAVLDAVTISPDGRWLASTAYDAQVVIRNARTGKLRNTITSGTLFEDVTFSPDGEDVLTAGTDSVATIWRARTGQMLMRLVGHGGGILTDAEFMPDDEQVLTTSADGTTRLWDISVGGARDWLTVPGVRQMYPGVTFSPDGSIFAAPAHPTGVTLWRSATGEEVMTLDGTTEKLTTIVFSPDGTKLAAGSDTVRDPPVWDLRTGELTRLVGHTSFVRAVTFTPDSERVITGGNEDGIIRVWDAATGEPTGVEARAVNRTVGVLAFAPDGRLVAVSGASSPSATATPWAW